MLILVLTITSWNLIFSFSSLACISVGIASSAIGTESCKMTTRVKKYKSVIKKYNKKHDKIVLLEKKVRYYWSSNFWGFNRLIF